MNHFFNSIIKIPSFWILLLVTSSSFYGYGQKITEHHKVNWNKQQPAQVLVNGFEGAYFELRDEAITPYIQLKKKGIVRNLELNLLSFDTIKNFANSPIFTALDLRNVEVYSSLENGITFSIIKIFPYHFGNYPELILTNEFSLNFELEQKTLASKSMKTNTTRSVLADGDWYKLSVKQTGVHKLDRDLAAQMGLDLAKVELDKIQLYGNGGLMLSEIINDARKDDLEQNAIWVTDVNLNNKWDKEDFILFYAQGPHNWTFDKAKQDYKYSHHVYADESFYFLTIGATNGKRITNVDHGNNNGALIEINTYDQLIHKEFSDMNVLRSGRDWYAELFRNGNVQTYKESLPDLDFNQPVKFRARLGVRSLIASSMSVAINNVVLVNKGFYRVSGEYDKDFMTTPELVEGSFTANSPEVNISFNYNKPAQSSYVYLDYYDLLGTSFLKWHNTPLTFSKKGTDLNGFIKYKIDGLPNMIWDISDLYNVNNQLYQKENNNATFTIHAQGELKSFVMFNPQSIALKPSFVQKLANQNLHGLQNIEYVIVSHPNFIKQAQRLAAHHAEANGYTYAVVTPTDIYNEFSSGTADITAMRDFSKMLYDRNASATKKYKFLLLFGDASFDYKNSIKNNTNFVPTFQSYNSINPPYSYCSDDYFAILDDGEGFWGSNYAKEGLDIGVGRIPCATQMEAQIMVDKIISYTQAPSFGDWRNQVTFLGDDGDNNNHFHDVEAVTSYIYSQAPDFNVNKIYLDAYKQEVFGSGEKYPDVNVAVDQSFAKGNLIFDYLGHGGQSGMAHERVVTRPQISAWTNKDKLPLIVTATCELSRFDDPAQASPGELMLFNKNGGGIGLITTSRLVYLGLNKDLNVAIFNDNIFKKTDGVWPTLGEVYMHSKNNSARADNQRNFILLGDPALTLNYPRGGVRTTTVNGNAVDANLDTLKALQVVAIAGEVLTPEGQVDVNFNGTVYPTVFDKSLTFKTLGNDQESSPAEYKLQNSVLYRGKVSANAGKFSFSFVVPKDIAYQYGIGKISYYAENQERDAGGRFVDFYIGGTSEQTELDTTKPTVALYMEDESFKFGDMVSNKPLLLAKVFDRNGINTVGNGIGRDITAILDKGSENERLFILNDFYTSKLDSYQEGEIRFPMELVSEGKHSVHLKLWDVYNNSAEAHTEFVVGNYKKPVIQSFVSFPNPTHGAASFVFNHNLVGQSIKVSLDIMSTESKIVYRESNTYDNTSARVEITDNHYNKLSGLASGMYIARLTIEDNNGEKAMAFNKIFIQ